MPSPRIAHARYKLSPDGMPGTDECGAVPGGGQVTALVRGPGLARLCTPKSQARFCCVVESRVVQSRKKRQPVGSKHCFLSLSRCSRVLDLEGGSDAGRGGAHARSHRKHKVNMEQEQRG
eukprot:3672342-Rhodomonas_salina.1